MAERVFLSEGVLSTEHGTKVLATNIATAGPTITQTYSTTATTVPAMTAVTVVGTGSTSTTPFGYTQAQADAIVTNHNALIADVLNNTKLLNVIIDALQANGMLG